MNFQPVLVENLVVPLYDLVRGTSRFKFRRILEKTQYLPFEQVKRLQLGNLRVLLKHAYETVPYYRRIFRERGLFPRDIKSIEDLKKLPILTKQDIRNNFKDLISQSFPRNKLIPYQSGGTGDPIKFFITKRQFSWEVAAEYRAYNWAGYLLGNRCFVIWGSLGDLSAFSGLNRFTAKVLDRLLVVNSYIMSEEVLGRYAQLLRHHNAEVIRGYATSVFMLAKYLLENDIDDIRPKTVITSAETLPNYRRKIIEDAFNCPVFDYYGSREIGAIAAECEEHSGYHVSAENVITEFLKDNEYAAAGERGEVILTNLRNFGMPFIRYNIGDVGTPSNEVCNCGRGLPLISSIEGRTSEFLAMYDKNLGRLVPVMPAGPGLIGTALMYVPLESYRVIQVALDKIIIQAVKSEGYSQKHTNFLRDSIRKFLGTNITVEFEFVNHIPPLPSGKRSYFISKVNAFKSSKPE